jgi:hypothetical protein
MAGGLNFASVARVSAEPISTGGSVYLHLTGPVFALIAGILILVMPRLLNFIVAIYLIAIGVLGLLANVKF